MIFTDKRKFSLLKNLYDIPFHFETGRQEKGKYRMRKNGEETKTVMDGMEIIQRNDFQNFTLDSVLLGE